MKLSTHSAVPVYTISGASTARPLPEWLARKRKRSLKQDPEYANRLELLQDFEFEEASSCVRASEDGDWVMSTGTYKPQIHTHYLPHLGLSFARHTDALNQTFLLLSSDYSKSLHLQTDRSLEFHTPSGRHYSARIPRYGRDLLYDRRSAEALVPTVGVNSDGIGEVFRLNLEIGRFMKSYEVDVGGDDYTSMGGGALQGGINTGSVNAGAIAEQSHNLHAFGTSLGTVEFWDSRSRSRVGILSAPPGSAMSEERFEITALEFHRSGLEIATGSSNGLIHLYDLRSPVPLLKKDQGYGFRIQNLIYLDSGTSTAQAETATPKILSADKRIIKIWDRRNGNPWTSVEPAVDLNHVTWCPDSGMLLTANEGRQQHAFLIPALGPAPRWCSFLDNLVEEMAEDPDDPSAFGKRSTGEVYDNYKFLTLPQLRALNLDHLIGTTSLLRPYMHGYFVAQKLYEEARLISNPDLWQEQRAKSIQEKITKERESRIRGSKKSASVKVNRKLAERVLERQEKNDRRRAKRVLERGGDDDYDEPAGEPSAALKDGEELSSTIPPSTTPGLLNDPRFSKLFQDEDFEIDETSREFAAINPSTNTTAPTSSKSNLPKGLTAVEEEMLEKRRNASSSDEDSSGESGEEQKEKIPQRYQDDGRISSASYKKTKTSRSQPRMVVSSSSASSRKPHQQRHTERSFGSRAATLKDRNRSSGSGFSSGNGAMVVGEKEISFTPSSSSKKGRRAGNDDDDDSYNHKSNRGGRDSYQGKKDRRSASGNVFRRM